MRKLTTFLSGIIIILIVCSAFAADKVVVVPLLGDNESLWNQNGLDIFYDEGYVGIGTDTPSEQLDVQGNVKFGSSGVVFSELREITGTTHATNYWTSLNLPAGYDENNCRVLSLQVQYNGDRWAGLGYDAGSTYRSISYIINGSTLYLYIPDITPLKNKTFRILIMKIG